MSVLKESKKQTALAVLEEKGQARYIDISLSFQEQVNRFRNDIGVNRKRSIKTIWEIGTFINILKEEKAYGDKTVESFIAAMDDIAVSKSEVYKWAQFAERYNVGQVNTLLTRNNMGWGVISNLMRVKDENARNLLEEKIHNGEVAPSRVQDIVSTINKQLAAAPGGTEEEDGKDKGKGTGSSGLPSMNSCTGSFKKMNSSLDRILTTRDSCAKDIADLSLIVNDEVRYEKAVDVMQRYLSLLPEIRKALDEIEKRLVETI